MTAIGPMELLMSLQGQVTELIHYGQTPWGRRLDAYFEGDLT